MIPIFKVYMDTIELGRVASQLKEDTLPVTNTFFAVRASNKPARPSIINWQITWNSFKLTDLIIPSQIIKPISRSAMNVLLNNQQMKKKGITIVFIVSTLLCLNNNVYYISTVCDELNEDFKNAGIFHITVRCLLLTTPQAYSSSLRISQFLLPSHSF